MIGLDAMLATGISARQLGHWTTRGYLLSPNPLPGSGHVREWRDGEDRVAQWMLALVDAGLTVEAAHAVARGDDGRALKILELVGVGVR